MTIPIQLAIQGGGARISYLLAALEALQQLKREGALRVTRIAGTSAGAIAGALYAARVDMQRARDTFEAHREELLRAFPRTSASLRAAWKLLTRQPFWDAAPLQSVLVRLLGPRQTIGDLEIPLVIVASDLTNMQPCVYEHAAEPLISSLMDSAGIPFFLRAPVDGHSAYRVIVDGGVCENLPSEKLSFNEADGEVVGITFAASRTGAPLHGYFDFMRAVLETALNASVLRAQLALGLNNFVIRTSLDSFDFARGFTEGLGAEYRETRLLASEFFRSYAERTRRLQQSERTRDAVAPPIEMPQLRLQTIVRSLRSMYETQQEPIRFEMLSIQMVVTAPSQSGNAGPDHVRHEIVFRAARQAVSCYRIRLVSAAAEEQCTQCEVFDRNHEPVAFDLVPITDDPAEDREYLLFFRQPIVPGDPRAPVTVRVRDTVPEALRLAGEGCDELLTRASRADRPIGRVEIVVHLPDALSDTVIAAAPGSRGSRMSPAELTAHPAPAGFFTLGWKGENVSPNTLFGCNLVRP